MTLLYPTTLPMSTKPASPGNLSQRKRGSESCLGQKSDSSWKILKIESEKIKTGQENSYGFEWRDLLISV